jgi:predicted DNA-binding transcriptional regulator YafY
MKKPAEPDTVRSLLGVVGDLLRGDRHSRRTIADATGKSLPTADRWIEEIHDVLPDVRRGREGKTTWISYDARRATPTKPAVVGACIAASLAGIFQGTQHERNLKDARDYLLRLRGVAYENLDRKFFFAPRGGEYALPEQGGHLDEIIDALLETRTIRFDYRHNDGRSEALKIEPLSLIIFEHRFYVLARRDSGFYPYRFARMTDVEKLDDRFEYPSKGEYDPRGILAQGFGIHTYGTGPVEDVEVVLTEPWATFALTHRWHPTQRATRLGDGNVSVVLQVRLCRELETWVLGFGEQVRVSRPDRLREIIASRLNKAAASYEPSQRSARPSVAKAQPSEHPRKRRAR